LRLSRASLARTSISGPICAPVSYAFDTATVTEKFSIRCHNPLGSVSNVDIDRNNALQIKP
jgi:hypothetical protein